MLQNRRCVPVALAALLAGGAWAVDPTQRDDFEDGSTMDWVEGEMSPNPPFQVPDGGPDGPGDGYLQNLSSGGKGPGSRQVMFNTVQWTGDLAAGGASAIVAEMIAIAGGPLPMRLGVSDEPSTDPGGNGTRCVSASPVAVDVNWETAVFPFADLVVVDGPGDCATVVATAAEVRWIVDEDPTWVGDPRLSTLGVDDIRTDLYLFVDGFESGDLDAWDGVVE